MPSPAELSTPIPVITTGSAVSAAGAVVVPSVNTRVAFAPPKAKLFDTATDADIDRLSLGT